MRKMKDSGIEWIGQLPNNWITRKFKYFHNNSNVGEAVDKEFWSNDSNDMLFYTAGLKPIHSTYKMFPAWKYTKPNDLLLARNGTPYVYFPFVGAMYTDHIIRVSLNEKYDKKYIGYCLQQSIYSEVVDSVSIATWSVGVWDKQYLPVPPYNQQNIISSFLDTKCGEISTLISDIQSQIEALEEYKKSLVFRIISRGIKKASLKSTVSDVWTAIPETWELIDIKYVFEIVKRIAGQEGFDVLSVTQKGLKVKDIESNNGQQAESYAGYQFVYPTDYVMNHMDLLTGWVDCSTMFGVTSPDYRVFRLRDKENNDLTYFKYVMQCCYMSRIFYSLGQGVSNLGRWRLQTSAFNNFMIPVPPLEEQREIANYLDTKISEIDTIIADKQQQIETIEEYKKSLIFEYVTGKKEVRS
ncbi:restriction endonuclease subunit S [Ruminococcus sp. NK3A76]|uniref:restriction endonuclease subunit S n=1 Tax=Ruminococcus sp. NK3A76 TaxID=877411 RepID=UPI00068F58E4|nr:restriction endonuclease subunit S [Ruminococcus sp. NK3A76]